MRLNVNERWQIFNCGINRRKFQISTEPSITFLAMGNYLDGYGKDYCSHCGLNRTEQGHDGCVGTLKGVMNACCGHGQNSVAYVQFDHPNYKKEPNKILIQGNDALAYIKKHSSVGK